MVIKGNCGYIKRYNRLTSYDYYTYDAGPTYRLYLGKIYQQNLHHWWHWHIAPKWAYHKDYNVDWTYFYTPLHNPPSEKILDMYYYYPGSGYTNQMWEYINRYNGLQVMICMITMTLYSIIHI